MILEIKKYPDSVLREKCAEVDEITQEIKELVFNMGETMMQDEGVGLSAVQVGVLKRIIVIQGEKDPRAFINPEIVERSKKTELMEEGCLSFPGLFLKIKRAKEIEVEALDLQGQKIKVRAEGLMARVFQHEIDHLNGILLTDRINFWQKLCRLLKI